MAEQSAIMLNAWLFPSNIRHQVIFKIFEALPPHQSVLLVNDHDPKPLFYQLDAEQPGKYRHTAVDSPSPDRFHVIVTREVLAGEIPMA